MSLLLIDVGNMRVKWAVLEKGRQRPQRAAAHAGWQAADFSRHIFGPSRGIERVIVSSVASARLNRMLARASRQRCGIAPLFVKTQRQAAGVTTKYEEPWRLGVDRFVAAIGATTLSRVKLGLAFASQLRTREALFRAVGQTLPSSR